MKYKTKMTCLLLFGLLFAACTSNPETTPSKEPAITLSPPTASPAPTLSPTPVPTAIPAPTETPATVSTDSWNSYSSNLDPDAYGYIGSHFSVDFPADWQSGWFSDSGGTIYVISSGDPTATFWLEYEGPRVFIITDVFDEKPTVDDLAGWIDEQGLVEPPHAVSINGLDAAVAISRNEEGYTISAWVANGDANLLVTASTPVEEEADLAPLLHTILQSIVVLDEAAASVPPPPADLSPEGQEAYDNIAGLLLTASELNSVFPVEEDAWRFGSDGPGLYMTCRTFVRPDYYIHTKFFSCVMQANPGFNLLTDDLGLYQVEGTLESAYDFEHPHVVYSYFTDMGRLGIDHIVQIDRFLYLTGMEMVTPLGTSFEDMFGEFEDEVLYNALRVMVDRAESDPPEVLDFPPGTSSLARTVYLTSLVDPALPGSGWYIGEEDERYDTDGACRILYHEDGPPPVLVNCITASEFYDLAAAQGFYDGKDFVDASESITLPFDDPYFLYLDVTGSGTPRYSLSMERNGTYYEVTLVNAPQPEGTDLTSGLTEDLQALMIAVLEANVNGIEE